MNVGSFKCTDSCTTLRYLNSQNAPFELVSRIMKFVDYRLEKCLGEKYGEKVRVPFLQLRHDNAQCFICLKVVVTGIVVYSAISCAKKSGFSVSPSN